MQDLKILTYVDAMKILVSFIDKKEKIPNQNGARMATQADIDRLLA